MRLLFNEIVINQGKSPSFYPAVLRTVFKQSNIFDSRTTEGRGYGHIASKTEDDEQR